MAVLCIEFECLPVNGSSKSAAVHYFFLTPNCNICLDRCWRSINKFKCGMISLAKKKKSWPQISIVMLIHQTSRLITLFDGGGSGTFTTRSIHDIEINWLDASTWCLLGMILPLGSNLLASISTLRLIYLFIKTYTSSWIQIANKRAAVVFPFSRQEATFEFKSANKLRWN